MPSPPKTPAFDIDLLRAVLAQTSDIVMVLRPDATVASSVGIENMGYREDEVRGREAFEFIDREDVDKARAAFERVVRGETLRPMDVPVVHADGRRRYYQVAPARVPDPEGELWIIAVIRDIHRRKTLETMVRASEQRYRALVEQSPFGILIIDEDLNLVTANQAYADQVGAPSLEALRGHNIMASPAVDQETVNHIGDRVRAGETISTSVSYESLFGKQVDVRVNIAPAQDDKGEFVAAQLIFEDVSESRRLEEQLRQSQKMEAVGRLAGGIAHDFNNNLTVILGLTEQLAQAQLGPEEREAVEEIGYAAKRSAALTSQLLAFSRRDEAEWVGVDINRVVAQLEPMLRRVLGADIDLAVSVGSTPLVIEGDSRLLEQVIVNLALNARDAMPDGGSLQVRVHRDAGSGVYLEVEDDGEGMDEQTRALSIEPFFTTKQEGSGTGLGLYTVYGIVNQFHGTMDIASQPGEGTRVSIVFPAYAGASTGARASLEEIGTACESPGEEVVLVLEDQDSVRKLLCRVLEKRGYRVIGARDGAEAIELAQASTPRVDLILSDVRLPDTSGPETVAVLRARDPDLQVLYVSGFNDLARDAEGRLADGFELITKPFSTEHLLTRVRALLDERRSASAPVMLAAR